MSMSFGVAQASQPALADGARAGKPAPHPRPIIVTTSGPDTCSEGAIGNAAVQTFPSLSAAEVDATVKAAAAALNVNTLTIAVVDRGGRPLALFRQSGANPANDDLAVGVARTAAFFSHNQAPLSSRTVRFISGIHFPPGVIDTPSGPLYGIENTNRGCDLNATFNSGKAIPPARSLNGNPCNPTNASGCGPGIVTGKVQPDDGPFPQDPSNRSVNAGGIPLYRILPPGLDQVKQGIVTNGHVVGGIGVVGSGDTRLDEFAAVTGAFGALNANAGAIAPVPAYPLPDPGNVYVGGVRLPFLDENAKLKFNSDGLPIGLEQPTGTSPGNTNGTYVVAATDGGCAANGYLVGPNAGSQLSASDVDGIVQRSIAQAKRTRAAIRLPLSSYTRMVIAVADTDGTLLAVYRMPDATVFSIDVSVAKSRNVVYFSGNDPRARNDLPGIPAGTAITNRTIGFGAQPLFPIGIDSFAFGVRPGPFYTTLFVPDLAHPCTQGTQLTNPNQNGIVFFPGASPLYRGNALVGGLGVSGDGVDQDDYVTVAGAGGFLPPQSIWSDQTKIDDVRMPMYKFPRQPEGVTECGGGPCS